MTNKKYKIYFFVGSILFLLITVYIINEFLLMPGFYYLALLTINSTNRKTALLLFTFAMAFAALKNMFDFTHWLIRWMKKQGFEESWNMFKFTSMQFVYLWMGSAAWYVARFIPARGSVTQSQVYGEIYHLFNFFPIQSHSWVPLLSGIALLLVCGELHYWFTILWIAFKMVLNLKISKDAFPAFNERQGDISFA